MRQNPCCRHACAAGWISRLRRASVRGVLAEVQDMLRKSLFALALLAGTACVHADENRGFTFGIGASRNDYELDPDYVGAPLKDKSTGFTFFGGYRFLP